MLGEDEGLLVGEARNAAAAEEWTEESGEAKNEEAGWKDVVAATAAFGCFKRFLNLLFPLARAAVTELLGKIHLGVFEVHNRAVDVFDVFVQEHIKYIRETERESARTRVGSNSYLSLIHI